MNRFFMCLTNSIIFHTPLTAVRQRKFFRVSLKLRGINPEINHSFHAQTEDNVFSELINSM